MSAYLPKAALLTHTGFDLASYGLDCAAPVLAPDFKAPASCTWSVNTLRDIVRNGVRYGRLTERQVAFARKLCAEIEDARNTPESNHVGRIDDTGELRDCKVVALAGFDSAYGYVTVTTIRDAQGNVFVYKGKNLGVERGDSVSMRCKIKAHNVWNGTKQTQVSHPRNVSVRKAADAFSATTTFAPAKAPEIDDRALFPGMMPTN